MKEVKILLSSISDIKAFVNIVNKYEFDVQKVLDMENVVFVEMIE